MINIRGYEEEVKKENELRKGKGVGKGDRDKREWGYEGIKVRGVGKKE